MKIIFVHPAELSEGSAQEVGSSAAQHRFLHRCFLFRSWIHDEKDTRRSMPRIASINLINAGTVNNINMILQYYVLLNGVMKS
ncbi:unnamed protein product [Euphydryas editha]|uniref:Uncharacterized protein n=1 Tax=Euphydryas editha TaxID=104508 RepID=A0AAU9V326_EUPED|nr:unnamed protein product [Euphydryas editha]